MEKVVEVEQESMGKEKIEVLLTAYGQWLRVGGRSEASVKDHRIKLSRFWDFLEFQGITRNQEVVLSEITREVMGNYQGHVFNYVSAHTGQRFACNTQIGLLCYLSPFFKFLEKTGRIVLNPCDVIKAPRHPRLLPVVLLSSEEMRRLLAAPNVETVLGFRDRCILEVLWSSAPRLSELCSLGVQDVDLAQGLLSISAGKGGKPRVVPLGTGACAWLRQYLDKVRPLLRRPQKPLDHLFISGHGRRMDKSSWQHRMEKHLGRARIKKDFSSHDFRHQLASDMLKNGADLRHIQQLLGHENITTTQRYLHVVKEELKRVHHQSHPKEQVPSAAIVYRGELTAQD